MNTRFSARILTLLLLILVGVLGHGSLAVAANTPDYVPLAEVPGLISSDVANSSDLSTFFNNIYTFCIGISVVLAVIQIIRGGLSYMMTDVITEKTDSRKMITGAVVGLLLVLSPYLLLSVINPDIISFKLGSSNLNIPLFGNEQPGTPAPGPTCPTGYFLQNGVCMPPVGY